MSAIVHRMHITRKSSHILPFPLSPIFLYPSPAPFPTIIFGTFGTLKSYFSQSIFSTSANSSCCKDSIFKEGKLHFLQQFSPFRHLPNTRSCFINSNEIRELVIGLSRMIKLGKGFLLERFSGKFCPYDLATILIFLDNRLAAFAFFKLVLCDTSEGIIKSCCISAHLLEAENFRLIAQDVLSWVIRRIGQFRTNEVVKFMWNQHMKRKLDVLVFDSLMRAFLNAEMCPQAMEVLYKMREVGFRPSLSAVSILFKLLLRVGDYGSVWKLFRDMVRKGPCPNNFICNVMILGFCRRGCVGIGQSLLHVIRKFGCEPDVYAYNILMNEFCFRGWTSHALNLMHFMAESGCQPSNVTFSTIIHALCKEGNVVGARELFDEMQEIGILPTTVTYNSLLDGYVKAREIGQANLLYQRMRNTGVAPDGVTFNTLVAGHYKYGREEDGDRFLWECFPEDMDANKSLSDISIARLCWAGRVEEAFNLLESMLEKGIPVTVVAFNSLISAYGRLGCHEKAFLVYNTMVKFGLTPSASTSTSLLFGLSSMGNLQEARDLMDKMMEQGFRLNTKAFTMLLDGYFRKGDAMEAQSLWEEMTSIGMAPDAVAFSAFIDGLCKNGLVEEGYFILLKMIRKGLMPNNYAYNSLIAAFCNSEQLERALELEMEMRQRGLLPDVFTMNIIINAYCKEGRMKSAVQAYVDMYRIGLQPDIVTYNTLISGYCKEFDMIKVDSLVNQMYASGWDPDLRTYNIRIHGFCSIRSLNRAVTMFDELLSLGIVPNTVTYNTLLGGICHDILDRAMILTGKLLKMGFVPNIVTTNLLLSNLQKQGVPERAWMWGQKLSQIHYEFDEITYQILDRASHAVREDAGGNKGITAKSLFLDFLMYITYNYIYRNKVQTKRSDSSFALIDYGTSSNTKGIQLVNS